MAIRPLSRTEKLTSLLASFCLGNGHSLWFGLMGAMHG
jgi:hypothetical protein